MESRILKLRNVPRSKGDSVTDHHGNPKTNRHYRMQSNTRKRMLLTGREMPKAHDFDEVSIRKNPNIVNGLSKFLPKTGICCQSIRKHMPSIEYHSIQRIGLNRVTPPPSQIQKLREPMLAGSNDGRGNGPLPPVKPRRRRKMPTFLYDCRVLRGYCLPDGVLWVGRHRGGELFHAVALFYSVNKPDLSRARAYVSARQRFCGWPREGFPNSI